MNPERIRFLRENEELTQEQMAKILGCKRSAYSLWEIDKNTIPLHYLNKMSNAFYINIDYLAFLSDEMRVEFNKNDIDRIELGRRIRLARLANKFSQEKLAAKLNTAHSVISAYESGKTAVPTLFMIEIARITGNTLNWFLNKEISLKDQ
ncbi:MAG: helix-turn-helix transcriptional regulator [Lachnospiraceae bacterium]|nr:helix-turn-helix transcriptional regulator [Lachnospiraceae bacterium]